MDLADRTRIRGGSTSGWAIAVADGMCEIAIGVRFGREVDGPVLENRKT